MIMYKVLFFLFNVANIMAIALLTISYVLTVVAKARKSAVASSNIVFPILSEQHIMIKHCFWCGTLFVFMNWLLCSSTILPSSEGTNSLSQALLSFGTLWGAMIFVGIVAEVIIKCLKSNGTFNCSVAKGIKSAIGYATLYFVAAFLIA